MSICKTLLSHPLSHYCRCIERLRARNERLTAALERRKGETERLSMTLNRLEANCSALETALRYWYKHPADKYRGHSRMFMTMIRNLLVILMK